MHPGIFRASIMHLSLDVKELSLFNNATIYIQSDHLRVQTSIMCFPSLYFSGRFVIFGLCISSRSPFDE